MIWVRQAARSCAITACPLYRDGETDREGGGAVCVVVVVGCGCVWVRRGSPWRALPLACEALLTARLPSIASTYNSHRLGWHRLGYGEMTEELRVPCDHLEKLHLLRASVLKFALF